MVLNKFINNVKSLDVELKNILLISNLFFISNMFINNFMGIIVFKENNSFQNLIEYYFFLTFFSAITMLLAIKYCPIFKLNIKTVNNEASLIMIEEQNSAPAHWNTYFATMNKFNEFLELHKNNLISQ